METDEEKNRESPRRCFVKCSGKHGRIRSAYARVGRQLPKGFPLSKNLGRD
jgi:hypothetical protein